jgi:hypothetical protein
MAMTGRQKIAAALSADGTSEFPVVIPYEGIFIRDHWQEVTSTPWWYAQSPDLGHQLAWRRDAVRAIGQDWFDLPYGHSREQRQSVVIEVHGTEVLRRDRRTGNAQQLERPSLGGWSRTGPLAAFHPEHLMQTFDEIDQAIPLPAPGSRSEAQQDGSGELAAILLSEFGATSYPLQSVSAPFWETYYLWGFEGMMTMVATRPDLVEHACQRYLERSCAAVRRAAALGAAGIWIEDCLTDMVSLAASERLHLPCLRQIVAEARKAGLHSFHYFCGNPAGKWDALLASGADALALEESKKGFTVDIEDVVERVGGRCTVLGNLDAIGILQDGTDDELRTEIARQVRAGRRNQNRFVMSLGSPVTPGTPLARVQRYCMLAHELGGKNGD